MTEHTEALRREINRLKEMIARLETEIKILLIPDDKPKKHR